MDILDDDLGLTAARAAHREGCKTLVAQVTLAQGGLMVAYEVTRLSRHCSAWEPLLDLGGDKGCVIAAGDGISAPATVNGRLLLGLTGPLAAWERPPRTARLPASSTRRSAARWPGLSPQGSCVTGRARDARGPPRKRKPAWRWCARRFGHVVPLAKL